MAEDRWQRQHGIININSKEYKKHKEMPKIRMLKSVYASAA
jgi:hypothetical protein